MHWSFASINTDADVRRICGFPVSNAQHPNLLGGCLQWKCIQVSTDEKEQSHDILWFSDKDLNIYRRERARTAA